MIDEALRAELLRRMDKDQEARLDEESDRFPEVDAENLPWLKRLVAERGWPGSSLVGVDERRAAVGIPPLAEVLARFAGRSVPAARLKCSLCDAWTPFEPPEVGETVTVTCTGCAREMTIIGPPRRA